MNSIGSLLPGTGMGFIGLSLFVAPNNERFLMFSHALWMYILEGV
ncbi:hypothetical protein [Nostoc sp. TCL26-01]|nr:hypothetical protein [Nostoc sp. TCL26-01]